MKFLFILFLSLINQSDCDHINTVRTNYHQVNSKEKLNEFIDDLKNYNCSEIIPYQASAMMQSAEYAFWPTKKLKLFNTGKKQLEKFISENPNDIEARYIRVLIQHNIPKILGYNKNIHSDIEFIEGHITESNLPENYKNVILTNIAKNQ